MTNHQLIRRGKRLAFFLRHDKGYPFAEHSWREVSDLINNHSYTMEELEEIVETNNKQRAGGEDSARHALSWYGGVIFRLHL